MSYRVEVAVSGRAKCTSTKCAKEGIKIAKGELRQGIVVQGPDFQSMKWRHWGCVTPTVLHNWWRTAESDLELVDGFDELPEQAQQKVKQALEQGHVEDEDWNGDIECNRYDPSDPNQGMFLKGAKLKAKLAAEAGDDEEAAEATKPAKKASKKRGRAADDSEDEKPAKKTKAKRGAAAVDEDEAKPPPAKKSKSKQKAAEVDNADQGSETEGKAAPAKGKRPSKKSKAVKVEPDEDAELADDAEQTEEAPARKPAKSRAKKSTIKDEPSSETKSQEVKAENDADGPDDNPPKAKKTSKRKKAAKD